MKKWNALMILGFAFATGTTGYAALNPETGKGSTTESNGSPTQQKSSVSLSSAESKDSKRKDTIMYWLKKMKQRLAKTEAKHNQLIVVAAVRGSEVPDSPPLYWKGRTSKGTVEIPELKEFETAVDLAAAGDTAAAQAKLKDFLTAHPKSPMAEDAKHTLALLTPDSNL